MSGKKVRDHFAGKEKFLPLLGELLEQLRGMNIPFQINPEPRYYIALVGEQKAFAWVHPKRQWIRIDLRLSSVEAAESRYTPWSEKDDGGYYHFETISQVPIVAKLIEKAYQKANGNERISR
jgi:hypothetical protein